MNNETKRDYPFPNTSSTPVTPVADWNLPPVTDCSVDWNLPPVTDDNVDSNPQPLGERDPELFPAELLKRIETLEKDNENLKIVIALIYGIASRYKDKLAEPDAWGMIKNFIHDKGIPYMEFNLNECGMSYRYINNADK